MWTLQSQQNSSHTIRSWVSAFVKAQGRLLDQQKGAPTGDTENYLCGKLNLLTMQPSNGIVNIAVLEGPNTLNPLVMNSLWEDSIIHLVYDPLGVSSPEEPYSPMPWLAERWTWDTITKTWRITLKRGIKWHDNAQFTAKDVKFSYDVIKEFRVPKYYGDVYFIKEISIVDDYTLDFTLSEIRATFIPSTVCVIRILPKHLWEPIVENARKSSKPTETLTKYSNDSPIGTGPFKYVTYEEDDFVQLKTNEEYFAGKPHIDGILFKIYKSKVKRKYKFQEEYLCKTEAFNDLKRGDIDYIAIHICPHMLTELNELPNTNVSTVLNPVNGIYYLAFNCRKKPFDDTNFRKAVAYLVDREAICNNVLLGLGKPIHTLLPAGESYWNNPKATRYGHGLTRAERQQGAKEILTNAGYLWEDGALLTPDKEPLTTMKIRTPIPEYDSRRMAIGATISYWLREIGIPASAQPTPPEELRKIEMGFSHDFDMNLSGFWFGLPLDPDYLCAFFHSSQAEQGFNFAGYKSPEFDNVAILQRKEEDLERRKGLVWEMLDILARDVPWIALYSTLRIDAYRNDAFEGWVSRPKGFPPYYQTWSYLNIRQVKENQESK